LGAGTVRHHGDLTPASAQRLTNQLQLARLTKDVACYNWITIQHHHHHHRHYHHVVVVVVVIIIIYSTNKQLRLQQRRKGGIINKLITIK